MPERVKAAYEEPQTDDQREHGLGEVFALCLERSREKLPPTREADPYQHQPQDDEQRTEPSPTTRAVPAARASRLG
jgi:hypothetical protein